MESSSSFETSSSVYEYAPGHSRASNRGRHDAYFRCSGGALQRSYVEIPRWNREAINNHISSCEKCSRIQEEQEQEKQLKSEGPRLVQYCLEVIRKARLDVDFYKRKKAEFELLEQKKREKGEEEEEEAVPDYWEQKEKLRVAEYDANVGLATIKREISELHKILHHPNKTIREGAREEYDKYLERMKRLKNRNKLKKKEGNRLLSVSPTCSPVGLLP